MNNVSMKTERNYGIDLFKIFSMVSVLILHIVDNGGAIASCETFSANYYIATVVKVIAFSAVNCFALSSGYVMFKTKIKLNRIISLWLQVFFYCLVITVVFAIFTDYEISTKEWVSLFIPVISNKYWYFTAYFIMFFFIPAFNTILNNLSKQKLVYLIFALVAIFVIIPAVSNRDIFSLSQGYSFVWLSVLYLIGGFCRKYEVAKNMKKYKLVIIMLATIIVSTGGIIAGKTYDNYVVNKLISEYGEVPINYVFDRHYSDLVFSYTFPTIILLAVILLLLFVKIKIKNTTLQKVIPKISQLSFSAYLIQTSPYVYDKLVKDSAIGFGKLNPFLIAPSIIGYAIGTFIVCICIDKLRLELFRILKIDAGCKKISDFLSKKAIDFTDVEIAGECYEK